MDGTGQVEISVPYTLTYDLKTRSDDYVLANGHIQIGLWSFHESTFVMDEADIENRANGGQDRYATTSGTLIFVADVGYEDDDPNINRGYTIMTQQLVYAQAVRSRLPTDEEDPDRGSGRNILPAITTLLLHP